MKTLVRILAVASFASVACGASAADLANGLKLSEHWCASCHVVSTSQKQASADAPTFSDIARRKEGRQLSLFLTVPHGQMPNMSLSQPEVADIVGYILSLGPNPPQPDAKPKPPESGLSGAIAPAK